MCNTAIAIIIIVALQSCIDFGPPKPVEITTPKSVTTTELPESNAVLITIDKESKVYFSALSANDESLLIDLIKNLNSEKNLELTSTDIEHYKKTGMIGIPFSQLKQFLDLPIDEQKKIKQPGIPLDTLGGELTDWIAAAKKSFAGQQLKYLIQGDNNSTYPAFKMVISALKRNELYKYNLITAPEITTSDTDKSFKERSYSQPRRKR